MVIITIFTSMNFGGLSAFYLSLFVLGFSALNSQTSDFSREFEKNEYKFYKFANENNADSALKYLNISKALSERQNDDNSKYLYLLQKAQYYNIVDNLVETIKSCRPAYFYFQKIGDAKHVLECVYLMTTYFYVNSQYDSTLIYCNKYLPIALKEKDSKSISVLYLMKGRCLSQKGKPDEAATLLREALDYSKSTNNTLNMVQSLIALGSIYQEINSDFAINYLNEARKYEDKVGRETINSLNTSLGNIYRNIGKYDSALFFYNKNLLLINKNSDKAPYGGMVGNIGNVYFDMGRYDEALAKQFESLEYFEMASDSLDIEIEYGTIADIYLKKGNNSEALKYYERATAMSLRLGFLEELIYNYTGLYQCYEKLGKYKEAYMSYKLYKTYNDSVRNVETTKKLTEQELNYRFENQQKAQQLIQTAKDELTAEQIKHQKLTIYAGFGGS